MFDICIIGGGTAGITAAKTASDFNFKTALFEKDLLGGVCLNSGCIPSKVYLESLKKDMPVEEIYEKFNKIRNSFAQKSKSDLLAAGVEIIEEEAEILPKNGGNFVVKAGENLFESKFLIIACGSISKNNGISFPKTTAEIPESIDIAGGGIAGLEAAQIFNALGSKVRVLEAGDKFCANLSQNAVNILLSKMRKDGIEFLANSECANFENAYCANGRKFADIKGIENLPPVVSESGIPTDEFCETAHKNCFAIGDINGKSMLAHTAVQEAFVAVSKIKGEEIAMDYGKIPVVLYTTPSIASVGVLPSEAGAQYEVRQMPLSGNGKFRAKTEVGERGLCEAVIEKQTQKVAGLHLISPSAEEIIAAAAIIVQQNLTVSDIRKLVFAHPTISEVVRETVCNFYKQ